MKLLLKSVDKVVNRVARENHWHLVKLNYEKVVLRKKRSKKKYRYKMDKLVLAVLFN